MYWGDTYAEKAMMRMSGKIKEIYAEAAQDIDKKIQAHNQRFLKKDAEYRQKVADGKMTQAEYDSWKQGQVFTGKRWQSVRNDIEHQINAANHTATDIVNGEQQAVFVQNVNYAQYTIDKDFQFGLSFNLYDSATVTRLIRDDPDMLPAVGQDEHKTDEWTRKLVSSAITQGVIQGESIPKISKRIAEKLGSSNEKSMTRIARTAMTSAQNAGRIEAMHNAQNMGIEVQKLWISTLDNRTRDAHRNLDGQVQNVDDPFISDLGNIMFPGDPNAAPANVWRCRCTLGWEYPEYQRTNAVRAGRTYDEDGNPTGWEDVPEMTYRQWERWKRGEAESEPIPIVQKQIIDMDNVADITDYLKNEYNIKLSGVDNLDVEKIKHAIIGIEDTIKEFPILKKQITNISTLNAGYMCSDGQSIYFNPSYWGKDYNRFRETTAYEAGAHETGHCLDLIICQKAYGHFEGGIFGARAHLYGKGDWNSNVNSQRIVREAIKNVKKNHPELKALSSKDLRGAISDYALQSTAETLAEAIGYEMTKRSGRKIHEDYHLAEEIFSIVHKELEGIPND